VVRLALSNEGYTVMDASGEAEADELCRSLGTQQIDLLIINHRSRLMTEKIAKLCPAVQVLVISKLPYETAQEETGWLPGSSFLQIPFTAQQLVTTVENIVSPTTQ
jgi:hypothetical protein